MTDMSTVIIPKSDQLNSDDLISGPRTIKITDVTVRPGTEQPVSIFFEDDGGKPYKPGKSMCRVMVVAWGPDAKAYIGRSLTLYRDPTVTWAGMQVGGIRISHMSDIARDHTMALTVTKQSRKPFTVKPLRAQQNAPSPSAPSAQPAAKAAAPTGTTATGQPGEQSLAEDKAAEARDRFMAALGKIGEIAAAAELDTKLAKSKDLLGAYYDECAKAMQAKVDAMTGRVHPMAELDEMEPEEFRMGNSS